MPKSVKENNNNKKKPWNIKKDIIKNWNNLMVYFWWFMPMSDIGLVSSSNT